MAAEPSQKLTGVILAGGLARRMGGVAKGLQRYAGRPLLAHVIERLQPQVATLLLNVNHDRAAYAGFGLPLIGDAFADYPGPLAGLHAGLCAASTPWVLSVPCDSPHFPADLASRLFAAIKADGQRIAFARAEGKAHPVFCLCHRDLADDLADYLARGGRRVMQWCEQAGAVSVDFPDPAAFANFNSLDDLAC
ncbi:molybdenum cofactor guanylyltransferase MobA [Dechloromonas sp. ZY10]|uniref:molybdenum cofactor guanylyltransferase MobA n=1 Tax=Dechloromonas aquae TaxID=2664436 RepID=UPI0035293E1D